MKRLVASMIIVMAFSGFSYDAHAITAFEIIERSEKALRGDTQIALVDIIVKRRRWTRTMKLKTWDNRLERKSFAEILAPSKDAGNRFLMIAKDGLMWQYDPDIEQKIKINPSMMLQSWMGSDFTNDDIVKQSSIIYDYTHRLEGERTMGGYRCYVIALIPKPAAAVVWGKILYYVRISDCLPVREEFYDQHGDLRKVLTCSDYRNMNGRVIPAVYKMVTIRKRYDIEHTQDDFTKMVIHDAVFNVKIDDRVFSLQNLERK